MGAIINVAAMNNSKSVRWQCKSGIYAIFPVAGDGVFGSLLVEVYGLKVIYQRVACWVLYDLLVSLLLCYFTSHCFPLPSPFSSSSTLFHFPVLAVFVFS
jgi:hypothetical protein